MGVDKRRVVGKGSLIREGKELDTPKVVQLPPQTLVWGLEEATSSTGIARTKVETLDGAHGGWVSAKTLERVADEAGDGAADDSGGGGFWSKWKDKKTPEEKRAAREAAKQAARVAEYERKVAARQAAKEKLASAPRTKAERSVRETMAAEHKAAGNTYFGAKKYGDACRAYDKALHLLTADGADYGPALCNRSACHVFLGRRAEAVADARRAIAARPDWAKARFRLGKALALDDEDLNGAANALDEAAGLLRTAPKTKASAAELAAVEAALADVEARLDAALKEPAVKKTECGVAKGFAAGKQLVAKVKRDVSRTAPSKSKCTCPDIEDSWLDVDERRRVAPKTKHKRPGFETGVFRPPSEAGSLLVRVTRGCQWNRCTYCKMYRDVDFALRHVDDVIADIDAAAQIYDILTRSDFDDLGVHELARRRRGFDRRTIGSVAQLMKQDGGLTCAFLQDADALFATADDLVKISLEELKRLKFAGLDRLHVGLETGSLKVTKLCRKGVLPEKQLAAGEKAMAAGFEYSVYVMPGLGGRELSADHVAETAKLVTAVNPSFVRFRTYCPIPGTEGYDALLNGDFEQLSETEHVQEMRDMIAALGPTCTSVVTAADHIGNLVAVEAKLPRQRGAGLQCLDAYLDWPKETQERFALGKRLGLVSGDPAAFRDSQELAMFEGLRSPL
ncbi:SMART Elongator protein 3 MiaB/NifB-like protein [Aureococcus anophagefferens]|nr:SMART Elongator protein 3 MiaB/NifB-like protein [Aureococcus anophagefferens]